MAESDNPEATSEEEIDDLEVTESDAEDVKGGYMKIKMTDVIVSS